MRKRKIEIAKKTLAWVLICGMTTTSFVGCKDYDDDLGEIRSEIEGLKTGSIAPLQKQLEGLVASAASLKSADEAIRATIEELEKTLGLHKEANDALAALVGGKVDQSEYGAVVAALQAKDKDFADKMQALLDKVNDTGVLDGKADKETLDALTATVEQLGIDLAGKIASLEESALTMTQVSAEIKKSEDKFAAQIDGLKNGAIADLEDATSSNLTLINEVKNQLDTYQGTVAGLVDSKIDAALTTEMKGQIAKIAAIENNVNAILGDYLKKSVFEEAERDLYARIVTEKSNLEGQIDAVQELIDKQVSAIEPGSLASQLASLSVKLNGDGNGDKGIAGLAADALALAEANETAIGSLISDALAEDGQITAAISTAISTEIATYKGTYASLGERLDAICDRLANLEGRIQSLVFLPQYEDGNVPHYFVGTKGGNLAMKFRVAPADMAAKITKDNISFFTNKLMSKAPEETKLNVLSVSQNADQPGVIDVTAEAVSEDFAANSKNAVALKFLEQTGEGDDQKTVNEITTSYFIVEGVASSDGAYSFSGIKNYNYTDDATYSLAEIMKLQRTADGRPVTQLGFSKDFVITEVNSLDISNSENEDDIASYLESAGFDLDIEAMTIRVKAGASIGDELVITLANESTGVSEELTFTVDASGTVSDKVLEQPVGAADLAQGSAASKFVWENGLNSGGDYVYTLNKSLVNGMIKNKTTDEIVAILQAATPTTYLKDDQGEYQAGDAASVSVSGGEVLVTLKQSAAWKTYKMKTGFALAGDYTGLTISLEAVLPLSYPTNDFLKKQEALWSSNGYLLQFTPVSGAALTISKDLTGAFQAVSGITYEFALVATVPGVGENDPNTTPAGVSIVANEIAFSEYVDLSTLKVKAVAKDGANPTGKETEFTIDMKYPVLTAFEAIEDIDLVYAAADISSGMSFDWTGNLQLKDIFGKDLMESGAFKSDTYTTTYGLAGLTFEYVSNDGGLSADQISVNATTGVLSLTSTSLAKDVHVTVKVTATNKYGTSESEFTIKLEKTN